MPRLLLILLLPWFAQHTSLAEAAQATSLENAAAYREDRLLVRPKGGVSRGKLPISTARIMWMSSNAFRVWVACRCSTCPGRTVADCLLSTAPRRSWNTPNLIIESVLPVHFRTIPISRRHTLGPQQRRPKRRKAQCRYRRPEAWAVWPPPVTSWWRSWTRASATA